MPATTAFDCLGRAVANLRANPELLLAYVVQQVAVLVLTLLSLAALVVPLWADPVVRDTVERLGEADLETALGALLVSLPDLLAPLGLGALLGTLVGGAALLVACWFSAGIFTTLRAGEVGVAPGPAPGYRPFRAFSTGGFATAANRRAWRYFWFINLYLAYLLLAVLVWSLATVLAVWCGERWGAAAGLGVGCLGTLPFVAVLVALTAWMWLGTAELAREEMGVRTASRRAAAVLRRRPWAVALFFVLAFAASLVVSLGMMSVDMAASVLLERGLALWCSAQAVLYGVQFVAAGIIALVLAGAVVALTRSAELEQGGSAA